MEKIIKAISVEIVVIMYYNGECIAYRKDDPRLLDELIKNYDCIEDIMIPDYFPPIPTKPDNFLEDLKK